MEKSTIGLTLVAAVAVWAFLSMIGTHESNLSHVTAQAERQSAEFDRDFARLSGAPQDEQAQLASRAEEAEKRAAEVRTEAERLARIEGEKRQALEEAAEADIRVQGGPDLTAVGERIARQLEEASK